MAWLRVWQNPKAQEQTESRLNDDGSSIRTCILTYFAQSDTITTSTADAESASAGGTTIPAMAGNYTIGGSAGWKCTRRMPRRSSESPFLFEVQCEFTLHLFTPPPDNSEKWDSDIQFSGVRFTQTAYIDKDGNPIVNAAKKPFDPSLERTFYDEKIDVSYKTLTPQTFALSLLRGYVNSDNLLLRVKGVQRGFSPRQVLLDDAITSSAGQLEDGSYVWNVKMSLICRQDTFVFNVVNRGWQYLDGAGKLVNAKDKFNQPVSEPVNLDTDGTRLADTAAPNYLQFKIERQSKFANLFRGL